MVFLEEDNEMRNIAGTYPKGKSEIKFNFDVPSSWEDLDPHAFATIIEVMNFSKADKYTISISLLALLIGQKNFHVLDGLPDELLYDMVPLTNFLVEEKPPLKNYFPELKLKKIKHIAPADDLSNIGFGEWCFAYEYYKLYQITRDKKYLNRLIATLYRPVDPKQKEDSPTFKGDTREVFNEVLVKRRSFAVSSVSERMKIAILAWFSVALKNVSEDRPHVFPESKPAKEIPGQDSEVPTQEADHSRTWLSVFRELLGPKWGTTEELKKTNAMFILDELEERQIEFIEMTRKSK